MDKIRKVVFNVAPYLFVTFTGKWAEWCGTGYEEEEEEDCGEDIEK